MDQYLCQDETSAIIGAAIEVHKYLKEGLLEAIYHEALEMEFSAQEIPYISECPLSLDYKGIPMKKRFFVDFLCYGKIIVEIKSVENLLPEHEAQLLNYLRVSKMKVGLLLNFKNKKLEIKRLVL